MKTYPKHTSVLKAAQGLGDVEQYSNGFRVEANGRALSWCLQDGRAHGLHTGPNFGAPDRIGFPEEFHRTISRAVIAMVYPRLAAV